MCQKNWYLSTWKRENEGTIQKREINRGTHILTFLNYCFGNYITIKKGGTTQEYHFINEKEPSIKEKKTLKASINKSNQILIPSHQQKY